jgi:hypothetical protein
MESTMARTGRPSANLTPQRIEWAIKSTQSMRQASIYLNVTYNTFKKYAERYNLWKPVESSKGIKRSSSAKLGQSINKILSGENPNPYRDDTLLKKAIREALIKCECSSCGADFNIESKSPPLMLDFLDKNTQNTHIDNLRALCFNCIYILHDSNKGWYKHRRNPIRLSLNDIPEDMDVEMKEIPSEEPELDYMPFEEFQKLL